MTRKRYIKLLMSDGLSVRQARAQAEKTRREGWSYAAGWVKRKTSTPAGQALRQAAEAVTQALWAVVAPLMDALGAASVTIGTVLQSLAANLMQEGESV